jgi:hypothetical protein
MSLAEAQVRPLLLAHERVLPVLSCLEPLLPDGGLRRGSTVALERGDAGGGMTSLALSLLAAASAAGSWCAIVGLPSLGVLSASGFSVELSRTALIPRPGRHLVRVVAALLDAVDLVLVAPPRELTGKAAVSSSEARLLTARARERGAALLLYGWPEWPIGADLCLRPAGFSPGWEGLGSGEGYLRERAVVCEAAGRATGGRSRRVRVLLPAATGAAEATPPGAPAADQIAESRAERSAGRTPYSGGKDAAGPFEAS